MFERKCVEADFRSIFDNASPLSIFRFFREVVKILGDYFRSFFTRQERGFLSSSRCSGSNERVVGEHINRRLKIFKILADRYRNRRKRFGLRFNLIAGLYNYELRLNLAKEINETYE